MKVLLFITSSMYEQTLLCSSTYLVHTGTSNLQLLNFSLVRSSANASLVGSSRWSFNSAQCLYVWCKRYMGDPAFSRIRGRPAPFLVPPWLRLVLYDLQMPTRSRGRPGPLEQLWLRLALQGSDAISKCARPHPFPGYVH